ncbi:MAG: HEAT repeat domain-containing protein [Thermoproteota archaeon]
MRHLRRWAVCCCIHFFDLQTGEVLWYYENHSPGWVLDLVFCDEKLKVFTGKSESTKKYGYSLNFEGELTEEDEKELKRVRTISQGSIREAFHTLKGLLTSPDKERVWKGLRQLEMCTHRFRKHIGLLIPYILPHLREEDGELFNLSKDVILYFAEIDPDAVEPAVKIILKRIEEGTDRGRVNDLRLLGMLGKIEMQWVEDQIPKVIEDLKNSSNWNVQRFAAEALGQIGSMNPELVKESIPLLAEKLSGFDQWVRDAALAALGNIGEKRPQLIRDTLPAIISCLKGSRSYIRKHAAHALGQIAEKNPAYVQSAIPILKRMSEEDSDEKVRLAAKRTLQKI